MNDENGLDGISMGFILDVFFAAAIGGGVMLFGGSRRAAWITAGSLVGLGIVMRASRDTDPPAYTFVHPVHGSQTANPILQQRQLNDFELLDQLAGWGV